MDVKNFLNQDNSLGLSVPGLNKLSDNEVIGIAGFNLYACVNNTRTMKSTAPSHVLEDGTVISDTIFLQPIAISLSGVVSDIFVPKESTENLFTPIKRVIGATSQFLPTQTSTIIAKMEQISNNVSNTIDTINRFTTDSKTIFSEFGNKSESKTPQEEFLDTIDKIYATRSLIQIETPYRVYEDMHINSFSTTKSNVSDEITFKITAQQIMFRSTNTELVTVLEKKVSPNPSSGIGGASKSQKDKGVTSGTEKTDEEVSLLKSGSDFLSSIF